MDALQMSLSTSIHGWIDWMAVPVDLGNLETITGDGVRQITSI